MPGLLRGVARTAVISGTATAVSNRVSRRQASRWAQQGAAPQDPRAQQQYAQPQYAPPPQQQAPASTPTDTISALKELGALYQQGILTEAEFAAQKAKILGT
ncbi:SHOCT domain-containing protein [Gordonia hongkongensis]|uniref:SHOCT domain-containing protein n=1 Tax=Gordonia hongkongensis TaxID=1701090 RepID=A0AAX3T3E3_9ACTN|nr:SHOCT domain-containing protein [Gordonia hongkongensis]QIK47615.1 SHOCT domain-containing protein [Gordonia terrae]UPG66702.1 SHOCT domain-containing protein [Gordonia hongkongensis]WFP23347.1 SHOCT domain-containing protein [Gordonia hongkongensis]